jgi:hypothetical protein
MAQAIEYLPSKYEALKSNHNANLPSKKKKTSDLKAQNSKQKHPVERELDLL